MPQPLPLSLFYTRGSSAPAEHVFELLNQQWTERYHATGARIDIAVDAPPAIWICISGEYPAMPHHQRRELVDEVMDIILGHADLLHCDAEGHA